MLKEEGELWGVSSTKEGREQLDKAGIRRIQQGIVSGIAGYLIAEGERRGLEVSALLAECNPMYPDAMAALIAVEGVSELKDREIPLYDYKIFDVNDNEIGFITSGTMSPSLQFGIALAYIDLPYAKDLNSFNVKIRNNTFAMDKAKLPFYKHGTYLK